MCPLYRESGSFLKNDSHCLFPLLHFPSSTAKQSAEECKMAKKARGPQLIQAETNKFVTAKNKQHLSIHLVNLLAGVSMSEANLL